MYIARFVLCGVRCVNSLPAKPCSLFKQRESSCAAWVADKKACL